MSADTLRQADNEVTREVSCGAGVRSAFRRESGVRGDLWETLLRESADIVRWKAQGRLVKSIADVYRVVRKAIEPKADS